MPNFILTKSSVILCPHGGVVMHQPTGFAGELINGEPPMRINDVYPVVGCPQVASGASMACIRVDWSIPSATKLINGIPVLTHLSIGICQTAGSAAQGPAMIVSYQTKVTD